MTVISPWSRGGWVNSQVFDHTSVIRFLERWTGVREPNISAWRRAITGDLTSCFDFGQANTSIPTLPDTAALRRQADQTQPKLPTPTPPPTGDQIVPTQEPGQRRARPLPYQPVANAELTAGGSVAIALANTGTAALQFGVYPAGQQPSQHDVAARGNATVTVPAAGGYDVTVHAPNGFLREFAGQPTDRVEVTVTPAATGSADREPALRVAIDNHGLTTVTVVEARSGVKFRVVAGATVTRTLGSAGTGGWYDLTATTDVAAANPAGNSAFRRRFAGHLETGEPSVTG
jgi:phospholipase C